MPFGHPLGEYEVPTQKNAYPHSTLCLMLMRLKDSARAATFHAEGAAYWSSHGHLTSAVKEIEAASVQAHERCHLYPHRERP